MNNGFPIFFIWKASQREREVLPFLGAAYFSQPRLRKYSMGPTALATISAST